MFIWQQHLWMVDNKSSKVLLTFEKTDTINVSPRSKVVPFPYGVLRDLIQPPHRETTEDKQYCLCFNIGFVFYPFDKTCSVFWAALLYCKGKQIWRQETSLFGSSWLLMTQHWLGEGPAQQLCSYCHQAGLVNLVGFLSFLQAVSRHRTSHWHKQLW